MVPLATLVSKSEAGSERRTPLSPKGWSSITDQWYKKMIQKDRPGTICTSPVVAKLVLPKKSICLKGCLWKDTTLDLFFSLQP